MKRHRNVAVTVFAVLIGFVWLSCSDLSTSADVNATGPSFAKGGKGGGKPTTYPVALTIYGNYAPGVEPSTADPRILGDGFDPLDPETSVYEDGEPGVQATSSGSDGGKLIMRTDQNPGPRTFWVDLRGATLVPEPGEDPPPACGTGATQPCTGKGYITTNTPEQGKVTSRLAVLWNDGVYQWRLSYGRGCRNDDMKPDQEVPVTIEIDSQGDPIAWVFKATDQRAWLLRWPNKGNWRKGMTCLGNVLAPFRLRYELR
jgi:hypothetical protein